MSPLSTADFPQFFKELNDGFEPFPWQAELARDVFEHGKWRACLDLPTAAGKTAVLEIAIFHLALDIQRQPTEGEPWGRRNAPVRIAFVVDRRLIVDQAERRARKIRDCLNEPKTLIVSSVADQLKRLSGNEEPLLVQALRGGLPREAEWARTPVQPTILLSTVDQVGARLLFRGYGVSKSMRPVHAGLLGSDCLIFLDEAHLSEPFRQSLEWIDRYRKDPWSQHEPGPWGVVSLSATPVSRHSEDKPFQLSASDQEHRVLGPRLRAAKPAELREIPTAGQAATYAGFARELAQCKDAEKVLVVVNRVDLARQIFQELHEGAEAFLLTGRTRELDREAVVAKLEMAIKEAGRRFFAIATQSIEAGADYDFDALVTQIAPLDSLRQRFGRLNRTGRAIGARAVILASKEELAAKKEDPVYGTKARGAWALLNEIASREQKKLVVDFGPLALNDSIRDRDIKDAVTGKADAPVMPPAFVDLWTCTNPAPAIDPDVSLFLHGTGRGSPDVQVVWRADIEEHDLRAENLPRVKERIELVPPRSGETLASPLWSVRRWLSKGDDASRIADLEGELQTEEAALRGRIALRWFGADDPRTQLVWPTDIVPGDTILVPASYGGCDDWGWNGLDRPVVRDTALETAARVKVSRIAVRLHRSLMPEEWRAVSTLIEEHLDDPRALREMLLEMELLPELLRAELSDFRPGSEDVHLYTDDNPAQGAILVGRRTAASRRAEEPSTETDDYGSRSSRALDLATHLDDVAQKTREYARCAGLGAIVREALAFAADVHDVGKGDLRFQVYLQDGRLEHEAPLAKSATRWRPPAAERRAREQVGLPTYWRHEALSVRVALGDPRFASGAGAMDRELALWLIGTHHGWGRPFFPHDDPRDDDARTIQNGHGVEIRLPASPGPQRLDFDWNGLDWAGLFRVVQQRYGPWETARLEAILRLADHRASEESDERPLVTGAGTR